ncbi:MAG: sensor histidine kinase, partial [Solirubrobacterales bacterium]|nr:sensor histidine kinase [Solirubrobacterales bacterium]
MKHTILSSCPARSSILHRPDDKMSEAFRHEALLYEGLDQLVERTVPFIREGLEAGEPVAVAMVSDKIDALREALGDDADGVRFSDMAEIGRNPARIIPALKSFTSRYQQDGSRVRGIGEPIWSGRSSHELVECQLHEALINVAFSPTDPFHLLCPYDVATLEPSVIHEARCTHPHVIATGSDPVSREYRGGIDVTSPFDIALPRPAARPAVLSFDHGSLADVRDLVMEQAEQAGLGPARTGDLVIAAHELATNSVRHGGGNGILRVWREEDALVCEVKDRGHITDPLIGRRVPSAAASGG